MYLRTFWGSRVRGNTVHSTKNWGLPNSLANWKRVVESRTIGLRGILWTLLVVQSRNSLMTLMTAASSLWIVSLLFASNMKKIKGLTTHVIFFRSQNYEKANMKYIFFSTQLVRVFVGVVSLCKLFCSLCKLWKSKYEIHFFLNTIDESFLLVLFLCIYFFLIIMQTQNSTNNYKWQSFIQQSWHFGFGLSGKFNRTLDGKWSCVLLPGQWVLKQQFT